MAKTRGDSIRQLAAQLDELRREGWSLVGDDVMPAAELVLDDPAKIAVLTQPLRSRMLTLLNRRPRTVKQLAEVMQVPVTRLYYHLNQLSDAGFVRVVATRRAGAQTESAYGVAALAFRLDPALFAADDLDGVIEGVTSVVDYAKVGLADAIRSGRLQMGDASDRRSLLALAPVRLTEAGQRALVGAIEEVLDTHCVSDEDGEEMLVLAAVFPDTAAGGVSIS